MAGAATISLIGLPGGGKSTVGRHLARQPERSVLRFRSRDRAAHRLLDPRLLRARRRSSASATSSRTSSRELTQRRCGRRRHRRRRRAARGEPASAARALDRHLPALDAGGAVPAPASRHAPAAAAGAPTRCASCASCTPSAIRCTAQTAHFIIETGRPSVPTLVNMIADAARAGGHRRSVDGAFARRAATAEELIRGAARYTGGMKASADLQRVAHRPRRAQLRHPDRPRPARRGRQL